MKKITLLIALFISLTSFAQQQKKIELKELPLSLTSESSECLINDVIKIGENIYITVDFIKIEYAGEDADGFEIYKIVNNNPKKRTFIITKDTQFSPWDKNMNIQGIIEAANNGNTFNISTTKGVVDYIYVNSAG